MSKRLFNRPFGDNETLVERTVRDTCNSTPLGDAKSLAPKSKPSVLTSILVLLHRRGPSTVIRTVPTFVINSIYGVFAGGAPTHVTQESGKVQPLRTDRYASTAVPRVCRDFRVTAPLKHTCPRIIFEGAVLTVYRFGFSGLFARKTAARVGAAGLKVRRSDDSSATTDAATEPLNFMVFRSGHRAHYDQTGENRTAKVFSVLTDFYKFHGSSIAQMTQLTADIV